MNKCTNDYHKLVVPKQHDDCSVFFVDQKVVISCLSHNLARLKSGDNKSNK